MNERNAPDLAAHFAADLEAEGPELGCCANCGQKVPVTTPHRVGECAWPPEPAPMPCEGKVCNCHEITSLDPAPSIPAHWDLITAGDGGTYRRHAGGSALWRRISGGTHRWLTTAEILAMGKVRRAVMVTLPDDLVDAESNGPDVLDHRAEETLTADEARTRAAELLAAALHAEEVDREPRRTAAADRPVDP